MYTFQMNRCAMRTAGRAVAMTGWMLSTFACIRATPQDSRQPAPSVKLHAGGHDEVDGLPLGLRLMREPDRFREAGGQNKTQARVIASKAADLARAVSGLAPPNEQDQVLVRTFLSATNASLSEVGQDITMFPKYRSNTQNPGAFLKQSGAKPGSVFSFEMYQQNAVKTIGDPEESAYYRIFGGEVDLEGDFPQAVAVGYSIGDITNYSGTGTLIGKNVVLTAGHCYNNCNEFIGGQIFIGMATSAPGKVVKVKKATQHPQYHRSPSTGERHNDLTVLVLQEDVTSVVPIPLASVGALSNHPPNVRAVGFGNTDSSGANGFGVRRFVTIPIASYCEAQNEETTNLGADAGFEFAAGMKNLDQDTCTGDSGGGTFIKVNGKWVLLGVTSRPTKIAARLCGDGGLYGRVDIQEQQQWIKSIQDAHF